MQKVINIKNVVPKIKVEYNICACVGVHCTTFAL